MLLFIFIFLDWLCFGRLKFFYQLYLNDGGFIFNFICVINFFGFLLWVIVFRGEGKCYRNRERYSFDVQGIYSLRLKISLQIQDVLSVKFRGCVREQDNRYKYGQGSGDGEVIQNRVVWVGFGRMSRSLLKEEEEEVIFCS